ncbi:MAG: thymidine phosphorylase [Hyphomicrobiaceae bacterium]|nr:thymidine phosphorylase [Hyphomicrobiaceae bacterium]
MVFLPQETIIRKRDGLKLEPAEIRQFINGLVAGSVTDAQASALAMAIFFRQMEIDERIALTEAMRDSGKVLDWSELDGPVVDKHSTGGVGDNVSLMLAPILAACGVFVPMISGRGLGHTGGTLDKFDSIPGYTTSPDNELFRKTVKEVGCAIIGQTADLAPADKILYGIRDVTGTVENVSLITASILSKKLAAGLDTLILDVKVGSGAFMESADDADELARSLVQVANGAGVRTGALITDMNEPLASAAGNAVEVRNAVHFLTGERRDKRLLDVTLALAATALQLSGQAQSYDEAFVRAASELDSGHAADRFARMVVALGGPVDLVDNLAAHLPEAPIVRDVFAPKAGFVSKINTRKVGMAVVSLGGGRRMPSDRVDPAVGFDELAGIGTLVDATIPIARIHARDEASAREGERRLIEAYEVGDAPTKSDLIKKTLLPET